MLEELVQSALQRCRTWNLAALRVGRALRALKVRRAEGPLPNRATVVEEAHTKAIDAEIDRNRLLCASDQR